MFSIHVDHLLPEVEYPHRKQREESQQDPRLPEKKFEGCSTRGQGDSIQDHGTPTNRILWYNLGPIHS